MSARDLGTPSFLERLHGLVARELFDVVEGGAAAGDGGAGAGGEAGYACFWEGEGER